jgi:putative ABC transport system substrate-binding protein
MEGAARAANIVTRQVFAKNVDDLQAALQSDNRRGEVAAIVFPLADIEPKAIARVALAQRMPTMFHGRNYVDEGGLASYRLKWTNAIQRVAAQIDKVFRGEDPGRIPFELPTVTEFVLNLKTARLLGLDLSRSLLLRANSIVD